MRIEGFRPLNQLAPSCVTVQRVMLVAAVAMGFAAMPRAADAYTDTEIAAFLKQRFSCPVLTPGGTQAGQVRGASGPVQVFLFGAEACPRLPFSGVSFAAVSLAAGGMALLLPQPVPTGVTAVALRDGYLVATSLEYAPSDPRCCPSRQMAQRWVVSGSHLVRAP